MLNALLRIDGSMYEYRTEYPGSTVVVDGIRVSTTNYRETQNDRNARVCYSRARTRSRAGSAARGDWRHTARRIDIYYYIDTSVLALVNVDIRVEVHAHLERGNLSVGT